MEVDPFAAYWRYPAARHVEGKAAIQLRLAGSSGGTVHHNNPDGICPDCLREVPILLPPGVRLTIVPPAEARPPGPHWVAGPVTLVGSEVEPIVDEQ